MMDAAATNLELLKTVCESNPAHEAGMMRLGKAQREALLATLKERFENNMARHKGIRWPNVQANLEARPDKLSSLDEMEQTGGEPDVVGYDNRTSEYIFFDCAKESPAGRRSVCYDREALESRKKNKPANSALQMAGDMGVDLLTEDQYRHLQ